MKHEIYYSTSVLRSRRTGIRIPMQYNAPRFPLYFLSSLNTLFVSNCITPQKKCMFFSQITEIFKFEKKKKNKCIEAKKLVFVLSVLISVQNLFSYLTTAQI